MSGRYKKNYIIDGWPIEDTKNGSVLCNDDVIIILNEKDKRIKELEAQLSEAEAMHTTQRKRIRELEAQLSHKAQGFDELQANTKSTAVRFAEYWRNISQFTNHSIDDVYAHYDEQLRKGDGV